MLTWLKVRLARMQFNGQREALYTSMIRDLDDGGSLSVALDAARFGAWEKRAAERGELIALAHGGVRRRLESDGMPLADALQPLIPATEVLMIDGGVSSNRLSLALKNVLDAKRASDSMQDAMRTAMMQPFIGAVSIFGLSLMYGLIIWPGLIAAFPAKYWPGWALPLIQIQMWYAKFWFLTAIPVVLVALYWMTLDTWTGRARQMVDRVPPWSNIRDHNAAGLLTVLASLIQSGATVDGALERISSRATPYLRWHIDMMRRRLVSHGDDVIGALDTGLFSRSILDQISDAKRTRSFADALQHMGTASLDDVVLSVKRNAIVSSTILSLLVGAVFLYVTAVQLIAVDDASNRYVKEKRM